MKNDRQFFADNLTIAHRGSEGRVLAWQTFKQKNSIVQNINISKVEDAEQVAHSVLFNGQPALTLQSIITKSSGDELTDGGIQNGGLKSQSTRLLQGTSGVLAEGHEIVREGDKCEPNRGNGPLEPLIQPGGFVPSTVLNKLNTNNFETEKDGQFTVIKVKGLAGGSISGTIDVTNSTDEKNKSTNSHPKLLQRKHLHLNTTNTENGKTNENVKDSYLIFHHLPKTDLYTHSLVLQDLQSGTSKNNNFWSGHYPIPLFKDPGKPESSAEDNKTADYRMELTIGFIVAKNPDNKMHLLPEGWLYIYVDNTLWREIQVKRYTPYKEAIYTFSDVHLDPSSETDIETDKATKAEREATVETQSDILVIPTKNQGKTTKIEAIFSIDQLPWAEAKKGDAKKEIETLSLKQTEEHWIEPEYSNKLQEWQKTAPARDVLVIPISSIPPLGFKFKYTDGRPYSYQFYKIQLGKKIFEGRLDGDGYTPYLKISPNDLQETLFIDNCEMINLDPDCPYPTHKQEIILNNCLKTPVNYENNFIIIRVLPPPLIINLEASHRKNIPGILSYSELQTLKYNGQSAVIFIHGFNADFGKYGHYPKSATIQNQSFFQLDDSYAFNLNLDGIKLQPSQYRRTLCCDLTNPKELMANFPELNNHKAKIALAAYQNNPEGVGELESALNGTGAHHWFTHMEYNFNVASGFNGKNYEEYARIIGIHWPGNVNVLEFNRAEDIAHNYGQKLCSLLQQLSRESIEINIVAHSLGTRLLLRAMEILGSIDKKGQDCIAKAVFWQAALPNTAFTVNRKLYTDRRILSQYTHATESTKSILVLHSENDSVLKTPYRISKKMSVTASEVLTGRSAEFEKSYHMRWFKDFDEILSQKIQTHPKNKLGILSQLEKNQMIYEAKQTASARLVMGPAMGYSGPVWDDTVIHLVSIGKLQIVDQQNYLTGHSHMKVPSKQCMEKIYKRVLFGPNGIKFGKKAKII